MSGARWADLEDHTDEFAVEDVVPAAAGDAPERETDSRRIAQRQKQVDLGKNTLGYQAYRQAVPKESRKKRHPRSPDPYQVCSKRAFDGQIKKWRRALHEWDPSAAAGAPHSPSASSPRIEEDMADASNSPDAGPKNGQAWRQEHTTTNTTRRGLPLKLPSAVRPPRPSNKRSYCDIAATRAPLQPAANAGNAAPVGRPHPVASTAASTLFSPPVVPPEAKQAKMAHRFVLPAGGCIPEVDMAGQEEELVDYGTSSGDEGRDEEEGSGLQPMRLMV